MNHSFECEVAAQYGLLESIIIQNFQHWIRLNRDNKRNFHDGRTWSYNSVKALHKQYFYVSPDKIRRSLDKLEVVGVLLKGNHGDRPGDRTTWYAFTDESLWVPELNHLAPMPNGIGKDAKAFGKGAKSTNKTDINTVVNTDSAPAASVFDACVFLVDAHNVNIAVANDFLKIRKGKRAPATETALQGIADRAIAAGYSLNEALKICCERGWASFNPDWLAGKSSSRALSIASPGQSGMSAKTAATVANLNAYFGEQS